MTKPNRQKDDARPCTVHRAKMAITQSQGDGECAGPDTPLRPSFAPTPRRFAGVEPATAMAVANLTKIIMEYESDTFSADGVGLRDYELDQMAAKLIERIEDHLDGVRLTAILAEIRES